MGIINRKKKHSSF